MVKTVHLPKSRRVRLFRCFLRSREEKKLAHLAGHIAGDGALLRPCQRLVHIGAFQYPQSAHVLLGLGVRPVGDEHLAAGLGPQRLGAAGRGNAARELPYAGSNHFAVESMDLFHHLFGHERRVEVVGDVVGNQILWHDFFSLVSVGLFPMTRFLHSGTVDHRSLSYSRWGDRKSTATLIFYLSLLIFLIAAAESAPPGNAAPAPVGSAPAPFHKQPGPRRSCPACGTNLHEPNAPGSNLPICQLPRPRRYASDRPLDHPAWQ